MGESYVKESLLIFGGVNSKKIPDGFNHNYNAMWRSKEYYQGGRNPLLFYMCPDADVTCARPTYKGKATEANLFIVIISSSSIVVAFVIAMYVYRYMKHHSQQFMIHFDR